MEKTEMEKTEIQKTEMEKTEMQKTEMEKTEMQKTEIQKTEEETMLSDQKTVKKKSWLALPLYYLEAIAIVLLGQILGGIFIGFIYVFLLVLSPAAAESAEWVTGSMYAMFIGIWLIAAVYTGVFRKNRPILKTAWTWHEGNNWKNLFLGIAVGFGLNGVCILAAWLHKDIFLEFDSFRPISFLIIFVMVFVQSSAEEFVCRGLLYQRLMGSYGKPAVAIVGNSLLFALLHLGNEGVTVLSLLNIFLSGILFSLMVYYMDSLWCAFAAHAAWNFTQNILFGLPNSGIVVPYSVFKLDASVAVDSFAYNVGFGIEGTVVADAVLLLACVAMYLLGRRKVKKAA